MLDGVMMDGNQKFVNFFSLLSIYTLFGGSRELYTCMEALCAIERSYIYRPTSVLSERDEDVRLTTCAFTIFM
jgi:hypothetical protein